MNLIEYVYFEFNSVFLSIQVYKQCESTSLMALLRGLCCVSVHLCPGLSQIHKLKNLPNMLLGISLQYLLCSHFMLPIVLVLCFDMNNLGVKFLLLECCIRVFTIREQVCSGLLDSIYAFQCILNVLLERIEPFITVPYTLVPFSRVKNFEVE